MSGKRHARHHPCAARRPSHWARGLSSAPPHSAPPPLLPPRAGRHAAQHVVRKNNGRYREITAAAAMGCAPRRGPSNSVRLVRGAERGVAGLVGLAAPSPGLGMTTLCRHGCHRHEAVCAAALTRLVRLVRGRAEPGGGRYTLPAPRRPPSGEPPARLPPPKACRCDDSWHS